MIKIVIRSSEERQSKIQYPLEARVAENIENYKAINNDYPLEARVEENIETYKAINNDYPLGARVEENIETYRRSNGRVQALRKTFATAIPFLKHIQYQIKTLLKQE